MLVLSDHGVNTSAHFIAVQHGAKFVEPAKIVIKKYGNRRLYDTSASRYVNLEDIAVLVRNGKEVQVLDVKTGEDLTRVTLTQIIVENARDQPAGLPLELLRQLVVASDHVGQEFIMWYLKSAFESYQKLQSAIQDGVSEVQEAALSPLSMMKKFVQVAGLKKQSEPGELEQLRQRLAELESRMKPARKPAKRRKKSTV
jgi:polyhydroxyalkanoate synthesis repressor PhaR